MKDTKQAQGDRDGAKVARRRSVAAGRRTAVEKRYGRVAKPKTGGVKQAVSGPDWTQWGVARDDNQETIAPRRRGRNRSDKVIRKVSGQSGRPLPEQHQKRFEQAFGQDLSHVQIHTDGESERLASQLDAQAFAFGMHIYFSSGAFAPGTPVGDRLLAHELTHVIQHQRGDLPVNGGITSPTDQNEQEAYGAEDRVVETLNRIDAGGRGVAPGHTPLPTSGAEGQSGSVLQRRVVTRGGDADCGLAILSDESGRDAAFASKSSADTNAGVAIRPDAAMPTLARRGGANIASGSRPRHAGGIAVGISSEVARQDPAFAMVRKAIESEKWPLNSDDPQPKSWDELFLRRVRDIKLLASTLPKKKNDFLAAYFDDVTSLVLQQVQNRSLSLRRQLHALHAAYAQLGHLVTLPKTDLQERGIAVTGINADGQSATAQPDDQKVQQDRAQIFLDFAANMAVSDAPALDRVLHGLSVDRARLVEHDPRGRHPVEASTSLVDHILPSPITEQSLDNLSALYRAVLSKWSNTASLPVYNFFRNLHVSGAFRNWVLARQKAARTDREKAKVRADLVCRAGDTLAKLGGTSRIVYGTIVKHHRALGTSLGGGLPPAMEQEIAATDRALKQQDTAKALQQGKSQQPESQSAKSQTSQQHVPPGQDSLGGVSQGQQSERERRRALEQESIERAPFVRASLGGKLEAFVLAHATGASSVGTLAAAFRGEVARYQGTDLERGVERFIAIVSPELRRIAELFRLAKQKRETLKEQQAKSIMGPLVRVVGLKRLPAADDMHVDVDPFREIVVSSGSTMFSVVRGLLSEATVGAKQFADKNTGALAASANRYLAPLASYQQALAEVLLEVEACDRELAPFVDALAKSKSPQVAKMFAKAREPLCKVLGAATWPSQHKGMVKRAQELCGEIQTPVRSLRDHIGLYGSADEKFDLMLFRLSLAAGDQLLPVSQLATLRQALETARANLPTLSPDELKAEEALRTAQSALLNDGLGFASLLTKLLGTQNHFLFAPKYEALSANKNQNPRRGARKRASRRVSPEYKKARKQAYLLRKAARRATQQGLKEATPAGVAKSQKVVVDLVHRLALLRVDTMAVAHRQARRRYDGFATANFGNAAPGAAKKAKGGSSRRTKKESELYAGASNQHEDLQFLAGQVAELRERTASDGMPAEHGTKSESKPEHPSTEELEQIVLDAMTRVRTRHHLLTRLAAVQRQFAMNQTLLGRLREQGMRFMAPSITEPNTKFIQLKESLMNNLKTLEAGGKVVLPRWPEGAAQEIARVARYVELKDIQKQTIDLAKMYYGGMAVQAFLGPLRTLGVLANVSKVKMGIAAVAVGAAVQSSVDYTLDQATGANQSFSSVLVKNMITGGVITGTVAGTKLIPCLQKAPELVVSFVATMAIGALDTALRGKDLSARGLGELAKQSLFSLFVGKVTGHLTDRAIGTKYHEALGGRFCSLERQKAALEARIRLQAAKAKTDGGSKRGNDGRQERLAIELRLFREQARRLLGDLKKMHGKGGPIDPENLLATKYAEQVEAEANQLAFTIGVGLRTVRTGDRAMAVFDKGKAAAIQKHYGRKAKPMKAADGSTHFFVRENGRTLYLVESKRVVGGFRCVKDTLDGLSLACPPWLPRHAPVVPEGQAQAKVGLPKSNFFTDHEVIAFSNAFKALNTIKQDSGAQQVIKHAGDIHIEMIPGTEFRTSPRGMGWVIQIGRNARDLDNPTALALRLVHEFNDYTRAKHSPKFSYLDREVSSTLTEYKTLNALARNDKTLSRKVILETYGRESLGVYYRILGRELQSAVGRPRFGQYDRAKARARDQYFQALSEIKATPDKTYGQLHQEGAADMHSEFGLPRLGDAARKRYDENNLHQLHAKLARRQPFVDADGTWFAKRSKDGMPLPVSGPLTGRTLTSIRRLYFVNKGGQIHRPFGQGPARSDELSLGHLTHKPEGVNYKTWRLVRGLIGAKVTRENVEAIATKLRVVAGGPGYDVSYIAQPRIRRRKDAQGMPALTIDDNHRVQLRSQDSPRIACGARLGTSMRKQAEALPAEIAAATGREKEAKMWLLSDFGAADPTMPHQAHHIIPDECWRKLTVFQLLSKHCAWHIDAAENGILLPETVIPGNSKPAHLGSHPLYSEAVEKTAQRVMGYQKFQLTQEILDQWTAKGALSASEKQLLQKVGTEILRRVRSTVRDKEKLRDLGLLDDKDRLALDPDGRWSANGYDPTGTHVSGEPT